MGDVRVRRINPVTAKVFIEGFPGVGLAGLIAAKYIIEKLNMQPVAFVISDDIPPSVTIYEGKILAPITVYGNSEAYIVVAESFIPLNILTKVASTLFDEFIDSKNVTLGLSLGGTAILPPPMGLNRKVSFIATTENARQKALEAGLEEINKGLIMGITAALVSEAYMRREDYLVLLAESDPTRPDPIAALALVETVNKLLGRNVDTEELKKTARELEAQHRSLHNHIKDQLKKSGVDEMSHLYYV